MSQLEKKIGDGMRKIFHEDVISQPCVPDCVFVSSGNYKAVL